MRIAGIAVALLSSSVLSAQVNVDTAAMGAAAHEFLASCDSGTPLWGRSLCGPMIFVDPNTRFSVATRMPPTGEFGAKEGLYYGVAPADLQLANTARQWGEERWSFVLAPVPQGEATRRTLVLHEAFHRIQPALGLESPDRMNPHLDQRDGRYWLRLELQALARAARLPGIKATRAVEDAILFRVVRQAEYPGADTLEAALEMAEGLAEYTGRRLALPGTHGDSVMADDVTDFEKRPSYTRALGYGTGPLLGLMLDRYRRDWRSRLKQEGFAAQLPGAIGWKAPRELEKAAASRARLYDGDRIGREEDQRVAAREALKDDYRRRLVTGAVLTLRSKALNLSFNPNTVVPLDSSGTVYPTGSFTAEWGTLEVVRGGVLVGPMYDAVRVAAATKLAAVGSAVQGDGWILTLKPGWRLLPDQRQGDYTVAGP